MSLVGLAGGESPSKPLSKAKLQRVLNVSSIFFLVPNPLSLFSINLLINPGVKLSITSLPRSES